jgi:hypothetical protein
MPRTPLSPTPKNCLAPNVNSIAVEYLLLMNYLPFLIFGSSGVSTQGLTLARHTLYHLSHSTSWFFAVFFRGGGRGGIRSPKLFALGWLRTAILLISASWVAGITGVSHQCPADNLLLMNHLIYNTKKNLNVYCLHFLDEETETWKV